MTETTLPMTRARWTILAVGVPVALAMIALCARAWVFGAINNFANLSLHSYPVKFSAPTSADGIRLTMTNGNLTFHTGSGRRIRVHGTLRSALDPPAFSHRATATGLTLNPTCRAPIGTCDASFNVTGPAGLPVDIDDSFGQLDTSGLSGNVTLTSNSGNISASHLAGTVRLNDSYGDIDVTGVSGTIKMTSNSGNIAAAGLTGNTQISDSYGDVSITGIAATDVHCTGQSGNITIVFATVPKNVQVNDSYGDVTLELPAGSTVYKVHTRNQFGSTSTRVPQSRSAQNTITVTNKSGNITIVDQGQSSSAPDEHVTPTAP